MRAVGIILAGGNNHRMRELSQKRAIAAMPIAGGFRAIDFALSNMTNSSIQKVAVLTQYNARSLNEHLSSSKWWDFGRKQGGLFVFTPTTTADNSFWYRGTADAIAQNLDFLKKCHEPYVIIASGDGVYKLDYNKVLEYHIEKKADISEHGGMKGFQFDELTMCPVDRRTGQREENIYNTRLTMDELRKQVKYFEHGNPRPFQDILRDIYEICSERKERRHYGIF